MIIVTMLKLTPVHTLPIFFCGLLLPEDQSLELIALNRHIDEANELGFRLDASTHPPYLRLYEAVMPEENILLANEYVTELASNMIPFKTKWGALELTHNYVILWAENNQIIDTFHRAVLEKMNILREGHYKHHYAKTMDTLTPQESQSLAKWGSPWADPFLPHVVIAKGLTNIDIEHIQLQWEVSSCIFPGMIAGVRHEDRELVSFTKTSFTPYVPSKNP